VTFVAALALTGVGVGAEGGPATRSGPPRRFSGVLSDETGKAMAGVRVVLVPGSPVITNEEFYEQQEGLPATTTGPDGHFSLPSPGEPQALVALTKEGYATAAVLAGSTADVALRVSPWCRIEGSVDVSGKAAGAGVEVVADWQGSVADVFFSSSTRTDAQGRFSFPRAFAGTYRVFRRGAHSENGRSIEVVAAAGKPAWAEVRAMGRPVIGKIDLPAELRTRGNLRIEMESPEQYLDLPKVTLPPNVRTLSPEARLTWFRQWEQTPVGRQNSATWETAKRMMSSDEGPQLRREERTFYMLDAPAGRYMSVAQVFDPDRKTPEPLAAFTYRFIIPPLPPGIMGTADELDLGVLAPAPQGAEPGDQPAPDIAFRGLDGKDHTLSEFKGKVVLLDFWGVWCGACQLEIPRLKKLQAQFGGNPDFKLISLRACEVSPD